MISALNLKEEVSPAMESVASTDVIMIDFAKAFDRVNHSLLVHKLNHYGIRGNTNSLIEHFLHDRKQAVVVDGAKSDYKYVKSDVPQGSVLGPFLFLLYINDLPFRVSSPSDCLQTTPSGTVSLPVPKTTRYYSRTSSIWRSGNLSGTCHRTLTSEATSCSQEDRRAATQTTRSMGRH